MQEVSGSIPLFSTKKALYFVESMVLFFLLKQVFGGLHCFACTVFGLLQAVPIQPPTFDFTPFSKNAEDASHSGKVPRRSSFHAF